MPRKPPMPCGVWFCPVPIRLLWPLKSVRAIDIGAIYGIGITQVTLRADRLGVIDQRPRRRVTAYSVAKFRKLWADDRLDLEDIGAQMNMLSRTVSQEGRRLCLPPRRRGPKEFVRFGAEFDAMWRAHVLQGDMARFYRCSSSLISIEARRRGLPPRVRCKGWLGRAITLEAFQLQASARATAEALRRADMVDGLQHRRAA